MQWRLCRVRCTSYSLRGPFRSSWGSRQNLAVESPICASLRSSGVVGQRLSQTENAAARSVCVQKRQAATFLQRNSSPMWPLSAACTMELNRAPLDLKIISLADLFLCDIRTSILEVPVCFKQLTSLEKSAFEPRPRTLARTRARNLGQSRQECQSRCAIDVGRGS